MNVVGKQDKAHILGIDLKVSGVISDSVRHYDQGLDGSLIVFLGTLYVTVPQKARRKNSGSHVL